MRVVFIVAVVILVLVILSWIMRSPERRLMRELKQSRAEREASGAQRCEICGAVIVHEPGDHAWNCPKSGV